MSAEGTSTPSQTVPMDNTATAYTHGPAIPGWTWLSLLIGATGLGCALMLWQRVDGMQEQLARQAADANTQASSALALARESQDLVRDAVTRLSVLEARVNEVSLQRGQLEELVRNLSRSRDETLVIDIESAVRMALQHSQLTGSIEPLVATLKGASRRIERAAQPRLFPVQQAMERDLDRLSQIAVTDTASLLARIDDLTRMVDDLRLANSRPTAQRLPAHHAPTATADDPPSSPGQSALSMMNWQWWQQWATRIAASVGVAVRDILRVSRIDQPDAMLLAPDQTFVLRENIKHQLLNARLAVLASQYDAARADLGIVQTSLTKYFDQQSRRTHNAQAVLAQLQQHMQATQQPALDDTLTALATAAAGH